jgi:hypothetical protein
VGDADSRVCLADFSPNSLGVEHVVVSLPPRRPYVAYLAS